MIDLDELGALHPDLPDELVGSLRMYAAIALARQNHVPGVNFALLVRGQSIKEILVWRARAANDETMVDMNRVTEDGAECLALLIVARHCSWRAVRRLQWRLAERADWIVEESSSGKELALEVSGTDRGPFERRIREKRAQAEAAAGGGSAAACVVRFREPKATLWSDHEPNTRTS